MTDPSAFPPPPSSPPFGAAVGGPVGMGGPGGGLALSSPGKRFGAWMLEILLIIVTLFIGWLIWSLVVWNKAQTPAKQILGMRCVKVDQWRPATMGEMALRELVGKYVLANLTANITTIVGGVMVIADDVNRQALWDRIAGTTVVEDPANAFGF